MTVATLNTKQPHAGLLSRDTALFLDFDGTLAGLADDPDSVRLPDGGAELLEALSAKLGGALALVSGRDGRDLARRTPNGLWRAGNHGDMIVAPGAESPTEVEEPPVALIDSVEQVLVGHDGVRLERKARVLALHTRLADIDARQLADELVPVIDSVGGYVLQVGKDIAELKPEGIHKGGAIERLLEESVFAGKTPLFLGDDTTDEDGFEVCLARGGSAIKIGDGPTLAPYRLPDPNAVWQFLKEAHDELA